jgi:hypothetical protein
MFPTSSRARPRTAGARAAAPRKDDDAAAGSSATNLLALMGGDIDRARLQYASRGASSKVGHVRQLKIKKNRGGGGGGGGSSGKSSRGHNFNFHGRLGQPSPTHEHLHASSSGSWRKRRPATAGPSRGRRGAGGGGENQLSENRQQHGHGRAENKIMANSRSMPALAKIPGTLRHSAMKGLAAMRPHDKTFHSRLLQLEVEFNERVRYLPDPQTHVAGSEESSGHKLDDVGTSSSRYAVFEEQFQEIIAHDHLFAHLLRRVKTEYDRQVRELTRVVYSRTHKRAHQRQSQAARIEQKRLQREAAVATQGGGEKAGGQDATATTTTDTTAIDKQLPIIDGETGPTGRISRSAMVPEADDDVYTMLKHQNARMRLQIEVQNKNVLDARRDANKLKKKLAERDEKIDDLESEALKWRQWVQQKSARVLDDAASSAKAAAVSADADADAVVSVQKTTEVTITLTSSSVESKFEYKRQEDAEAESKAEAAAAESEHLREEVRLLRAALAEERSAARAAGLATGSSVLWDDGESIVEENSGSAVIPDGSSLASGAATALAAGAVVIPLTPAAHPNKAMPNNPGATPIGATNMHGTSCSSASSKVGSGNRGSSGVRGGNAGIVGGSKSASKMPQQRLPPSSSPASLALQQQQQQQQQPLFFVETRGDEKSMNHANTGTAGSLTPKPCNALGSMMALGSGRDGGRDGGRDAGFAMLSRSNVMLMEIPEGNEALVSPGESLSSVGGVGTRGMLRSNRSLSFGGGTGGFNTGRSIGGRSVVSVSELSEASQMSVVEALQIEDLGKRDGVPSLELG